MLPTRTSSKKGGSPLGTNSILAIVLMLCVLGLLYHFNAFRNRIAVHVSNEAEESLDMTTRRARLLEQIAKFNSDAGPDMVISMGGRKEEEAADTGCQETSSGTSSGNSILSVKEPADKRYPMRSKEEVEKENPELASKLKQHAIDNEIMLALANNIMICKNTTVCWWNGGNILQTFIEILQYNNVTNHLIGVLDKETETYLEEHNEKSGSFQMNYFFVDIPIPKVQEKSHPANKVSTIKYTLLMDLIQMGYHTLITDMDLVYMKNPFNHIHRDSDIEIQTDGFDGRSYGELGGVHDPSMGWGAGGLYITLFTTNVGCLYVKANQRSYTLMKQVSDHLLAKPGWDQQVFNEYAIRPSHGSFQHSGVSLRVMDYMLWMNSKIFFKTLRNQFIPGEKSKAAEPILVHFNYHPDKHRRMLCIVDRYHKGIKDACDKLPGGSEEGS